MIGVARRMPSFILTALLHSSRLVLGVVFIASSLPKLRNPFAFLSSVYAYEMTGPTLSKILAATIPMLELAVGCLLLGGVLLGGALVTGLLLCMVFIVGQVSAMSRGLSIGCGCFDIAGSTALVGWGTLFRTLGLTGIAAVGLAALFMIESRPHATDHHDVAKAPPTRGQETPSVHPAHA